MRFRIPLILYLRPAGYTLVRKTKKLGKADVPPVEVESLANDQERFFSGEKGLSSPRDILIRRIPAEDSS